MKNLIKKVVVSIVVMALIISVMPVSAFAATNKYNKIPKGQRNMAEWINSTDYTYCFKGETFGIDIGNGMGDVGDQEYDPTKDFGYIYLWKIADGQFETLFYNTKDRPQLYSAELLIWDDASQVYQSTVSGRYITKMDKKGNIEYANPSAIMDGDPITYKLDKSIKGKATRPSNPNMKDVTVTTDLKAFIRSNKYNGVPFDTVVKYIDYRDASTTYNNSSFYWLGAGNIYFDTPVLDWSVNNVTDDTIEICGYITKKDSKSGDYEVTVLGSVLRTDISWSN